MAIKNRRKTSGGFFRSMKEIRMDFITYREELSKEKEEGQLIGAKKAEREITFAFKELICNKNKEPLQNLFCKFLSRESISHIREIEKKLNIKL